MAAAAAAAHLLPTHPSASAVHNEARNVVVAAAAVAFAGVARPGGGGVGIGCDRCWSVPSSVLKMGGGKKKENDNNKC